MCHGERDRNPPGVTVRGTPTLFWPEFVEHDGCVFFADFSIESYCSFVEHCSGDLRRVETVMDHRQVFGHEHHHSSFHGG